MQCLDAKATPQAASDAAGIGEARSGSLTDRLTREHKMTLHEAQLILNVKAGENLEGVLKVRGFLLLQVQTLTSYTHSELRAPLQSQLAVRCTPKDPGRRPCTAAASALTLYPVQSGARARAVRGRNEGRSGGTASTTPAVRGGRRRTEELMAGLRIPVRFYFTAAIDVITAVLLCTVIHIQATPHLMFSHYLHVTQGRWLARSVNYHCYTMRRLQKVGLWD
jgi:hypothetical protein